MRDFFRNPTTQIVCGIILLTLALFSLVTDQGKRYILQGINGKVFPDVSGMMENIAAVTGFVGQREADPRGTLHIVPAEDGDIMYTDEKGQSWRVYDFVEDSICLQAAETPEDFYQSAVAFGRFQDMLTRFPADTLHSDGYAHRPPAGASGAGLQ